jgi:hypothetical protein
MGNEIVKKGLFYGTEQFGLIEVVSLWMISWIVKVAVHQMFQGRGAVGVGEGQPSLST